MGPCALNSSTGRCKKSTKADGNCEVVNGRCVRKTKSVSKPAPTPGPKPSPTPGPPTPYPSPPTIVSCKGLNKGPKR